MPQLFSPHLFPTKYYTYLTNPYIISTYETNREDIMYKANLPGVLQVIPIPISVGKAQVRRHWAVNYDTSDKRSYRNINIKYYSVAWCVRGVLGPAAVWPAAGRAQVGAARRCWHVDISTRWVNMLPIHYSPKSFAAINHPFTFPSLLGTTTECYTST